MNERWELRPQNQVGPHRFEPLRRFFNRGRCRACYVPEHAHPIVGWTEARAVGDRKVAIEPYEGADPGGR